MTLRTYLQTSVGKKKLMGLTGLGLTGFVLIHMLGNLLLFAGPEAYNRYGYAITASPIYYVIELVLLMIFVVHMGLGIRLTIEARRARPQGYRLTPNGDKESSRAAQMMIHQGVVILLFVISHLITFRFGPVYTVEYNGVVMRDLYQLMVEVFAGQLFTVGYVICMLIIGLHLSHGVYSSLQSLGLTHPKYTPAIKSFSLGIAAFIAGGFILQPIYLHFFINA